MLSMLSIVGPPPWLPTPKKHMNSSMGRSEEHTSELQSRLHLVCRLLLEKKKKKKKKSNEKKKNKNKTKANSKRAKHMTRCVNPTRNDTSVHKLNEIIDVYTT